MQAIVYTTPQRDEDLFGILSLQKRNLAIHLSDAEIATQGFVTVAHSFDDLSKMNAIEQSVIAKDDQQVIGYLLAMTDKSKLDIPVLIPMFEIFEEIEFGERTLADYNYIVVGQVCVDKAYRGGGVLDGLYRYYRDRFMDRYDFAVTEIASTNLRSLKAHARNGFKTIHQYTAPDGVAWCIVLLEW